MEDILKEIVTSPLSTILGIGGIIFLFLAFVGKVGGKVIINISPDRQKEFLRAGIALLLGSVFLYVLPFYLPSQRSTPTPMPTPTPTPTYTVVLRFPTSTPAPSPTRALTAPTIPMSTISAEQAIRDYYLLIQQGQYAVAWEMSEEYILGKGISFAIYTNEWEKSGPATIVEPVGVVEGDDAATITLTLYYSKKDVYHKIRYELVCDSAHGNQRFGYWIFVKGKLLY